MHEITVLVLLSVLYSAISFSSCSNLRRNVVRSRASLSMHKSNSECTCPTNINVLGGKYQQLPDLFTACAEQIPTQPMLVDNIHGDSISLNYGQFNDLCTAGASGLQALGLKQGQCVSVFAENSYKWLVMDQSVMKTGAHNAVRGVAAPVDELNYIFDNSKSTGLIVENEAMLDRLLSHPSWTAEPRFIIILWSSAKNPATAKGSDLEDKYFPKLVQQERAYDLVGGGVHIGGDTNMNGTRVRDHKNNRPRIVYYDELILNSHISEYIAQTSKSPQDTATILYTSGTTAQPKGVVLRHRLVSTPFNSSLPTFGPFSSLYIYRGRLTDGILVFPPFHPIPSLHRIYHSNIMHQVNYNTFSQTHSTEWDPKVG